MEIEQRKIFETLRKKVLWFGRTFLLSDGGKEWEKAEKLPYRIIPWADFYLEIENGKFEEVCKELSAMPLSPHDRESLVQVISKFVQQINNLNIPEAINSKEQKESWKRIAIYPYTMQNYEEQLNHLFDLDIVYNAPWNEPVNGSSEVIISADNHFYKDCLLAVYTRMLEWLQNRESIPIESNNANPVKEEENSLEDEEAQPGENLIYKVALMHRLGFLDRKKWPDNATQEQISNVLATILGSEQSPVKVSSLKRYLKALLNHDYEGEKITKKYGSKIDGYLKEVFPDWEQK